MRAAAVRFRQECERLLFALQNRRNTLRSPLRRDMSRDSFCPPQNSRHLRTRPRPPEAARSDAKLAGTGLPRRLSHIARAALLALGLSGGLIVTAGGVAPGAHARESFIPEKPRQIEVFAHPLATFRPGAVTTTFGQLTFLGGLVLSSPDPVFGGISGFHLFQEDNRFLAVTDKGTLLSGRLDVEGERPLGLSNVMAEALKDEKGRPLARRGRGDAESITLAPDAVYIGLERVNEIWRFPRPPKSGNGAQVKVPAGVRKLRNNLGLESLLYVPSGPLKGALLGIGETGIRDGEDLPGFIIGGPMPGSFTITKSGAFNATDAALGPDGDMFLLERHFSWFTGVLMQLRRFRLEDILPGAVLSGEVLGTFNSRYEIDNMEALSATRGADGRTLLTLISDNNFSLFQRTLLLRFALPPR